MKAIHILTACFFATALTASAQLPAKRTMKKSKTEVVKTDASAEAEETEAPQVPEGRAPKKPATPAQKPAAPKATPAAPVNNQRKPAAPANQQKPAPGGNGRPGAAAANTAPPAGGSYRDFPTAATMPEDAAWRRDVYRTLDLSREENAVLYFPVVPTGGRQNLFVYLFRQVLRGQIKAYEYTLDANEHFDEEHQLKGKKIMDTHNIYYEEVDAGNGKKSIRVNDADLPSEDVKLYFVKESVYYDQHTASFRTKVTALCPVMVSGMNDFGEDESQRVPLFWINYEEAAPYLAKLSLMGSSMNNAAAISADDYFTMNRYAGDIYKTTNLQDRIIAQYAETEEEQLAERKRIEGELAGFEKHVWGHEPERLLDAYGNPVLDAFDKPIIYNNERQLIDSKGRHIAFAIAGKDSTNVASDTPDVEPKPTIVLINELGFAVDEEGNPLLREDGTPLEFIEEFPTPEALEANKKKTSSRATSSSATSRRSNATSTTTRRTTTTSKDKSKGGSASKTAKPKTPKASKPSPSKGNNGGLSVRKERH